ncbi:MAG: NAD(P)/FAD-dependent oxidoreductase [Bacteriovoracaceae bacterium]
MNERKIYQVCVIGGGSAGTMAALRTVLNNDECLFFPGTPKDKKRSRALWVRRVENMPAHLEYKRGIEEPNMATIKWLQSSDFKDKFFIHKNVGVTSIKKLEDETFEITSSKNEVYYAQYVILCTGVADVQPVVNGSIEPIFDYANAQTADYCLICDGHHVLNKKTAVIGHTTSAAWVAIMLHERYHVPITILTHGQDTQFNEETQKLIEKYKFQIIKNEITGFEGEEKGILSRITLKDHGDIPVDICFVSLGMIVYNELAKMLGADLDERGFVKANTSGETSVSNLYVAGDLKANTRKQIYTAWDHAVSAATEINQKIRIKKR